MKKIKFLSIPLIVCMLVMFAFTGCSDNEIVSASIRTNSFKQYYNVDDELDLTNAYLVVDYKNGESSQYNITEEMISGFDTTTTGKKTMTITYQGTAVEYQFNVYNDENALYDILTTARLSVLCETVDSDMRYSFYFSKGDMAETKAFLFDIEFNDTVDITDDNYTLTTQIDGWNSRAMKKTAKTIRLLIYSTNEEGLTESGYIATFTIDGCTTRNVALKNIKISDGTNDYYLPKTK